MTSEEYAKRLGVRCPVCGSGLLEGGNFEIDEEGAVQVIDCRACGSTWLDTYKLTGYANLQKQG